MKTIKVGLGTCGISAGGELVYNKLKDEIDSKKLDVELNETGCMGMCYEEVLVEIVDNGNSCLYSNVTVDKVGRIVNEHLINDHPIIEWIIKSKDISKEEDFLKNQKRIVLRNCGVIDPTSVEDYMKYDGYKAVQTVLMNHSPEELIEMITKSGLRGRGGAGFLTGQKWKFAYQEKSDKKYLICNADEGDPGAFMDRSVLEGDPHSVLEGMMIAAYAIGADEGYIYCRAEYPLAIKRLRNALRQCETKGFLGENIFGSNFSFKIKIKEGAGAFVCG
ncbi:NADH-quinone oxidoreductase subunit F, partial [bacterium]|nr:NADH-quinone oxidoreductase subunit F [bacterium]